MPSSRLRLFLTALGLSVLAAACQRDTNTELIERLDRIEKQVTQLNERMQRMPAGNARGQQGERKRHDPAVTYAVPIEGSPSKGPDDALVTVVEAFEFACPACENARGVVKEIADAYPKDVRVVYRYFIIHPQAATIPGIASCAAKKQGKYLEMAELIWEKGYKANRNLGVENMEKLAGEVGLDPTKFKEDSKAGGDCEKQIRAEHASMQAIGVGATPTLFVNGRNLARRSPDEFKALIDEELAKAKQRVAQGTRPGNYYKEWVLDKGNKRL